MKRAEFRSWMSQARYVRNSSHKADTLFVSQERAGRTMWRYSKRLPRTEVCNPYLLSTSPTDTCTIVTLWWANMVKLFRTFFHVRRGREDQNLQSVPKTELLEVRSKGRTWHRANNDRKLSRPNTPTWSQCRIHNTVQKKINKPKACCQGILAGNPLIALIFQSDAESLSRHTTAELKGRDGLPFEATVFLYNFPSPATANGKCFRGRSTLGN